MITEVLARSLTLEELADRLSDHEDPAVAYFAIQVLEANVLHAARIEELEADAENADDQAEKFAAWQSWYDKAPV